MDVNIRSTLLTFAIAIGTFVSGLAVGATNARFQPEAIVTHTIDTLILSQSEYRDHIVTEEAKRAGVPVELRPWKEDFLPEK